MNLNSKSQTLNSKQILNNKFQYSKPGIKSKIKGQGIKSKIKGQKSKMKIKSQKFKRLCRCPIGPIRPIRPIGPIGRIV